MSFPPSFHRARRLREHPLTRSWCRETRLHPAMFVYPVFVREGSGPSTEVASMPGVFQYTLPDLARHLEKAVAGGLTSVLVFGVPLEKDPHGSEAFKSSGVVQGAVRDIRRLFPSLHIVTDICMCQYTSHGHCGLVNDRGHVENDPTLELLAKVALSHAEAGADMVAPSDMMDGRVAAIRRTLDQGGFTGLPIMSYAVKYASAFYGPFRDAAHSAPQFGDRQSYQMDFANGREAIREAEADLREGADILMVKPGLAYLDILARLRRHLNCPLAVYNVSGEYSMVKAAARNGWIDERKIVIEAMTAMARAGASVILTYHALDLLKWIKEG